MTNTEWLRLRAFRYAQTNRPVTNRNQSRRVAKKNVGKAKGQRFLKQGYITHTVHIDTIFKKQ